jgi:RNA polymerase sigma factor (sigma-70 family)
MVQRAMMTLEGFRGRSKLSTWFYKLAVNEANRALRDRITDRDRLVSLTIAGPDEEEPALDIKAKPVNQDARIDLEKLGCRLPSDQAEVMSLLQEGYTLEEVAQKTRAPLGTIRSRYRLAKDKLKKAHLKRNHGRPR